MKAISTPSVSTPARASTMTLAMTSSYSEMTPTPDVEAKKAKNEGKGKVKDEKVGFEMVIGVRCKTETNFFYCRMLSDIL